jgi:hypothetical protein
MRVIALLNVSIVVIVRDLMGTLPGVNFGFVGAAILKWRNKIFKCRGRGPGSRPHQRRRPLCAGENASINVVKLVYLDPK